jgi:hypothetical protein
MGGDAGAHGAGAENGNFVNTLHECDSCNKKILLLDCGENSPRFLKLHSLDFVILSEAKDLLPAANRRSFASLRMTIPYQADRS